MNPIKVNEEEYVFPFKYQSIKWIKVVKQKDYYRVTLMNFYDRPMFDYLAGLPYERDGVHIVYRGPLEPKVKEAIWSAVMTFHNKLIGSI